MIESPIADMALPRFLAPHSKAFEFQGKGEIHYTILRDKLHRIARKIRSEMRTERTGEKRFGQVLTEILFEEKRYALGLLVERPHISPTYTRKGPPVQLEDAARGFRNAHKDVRERQGYLYVDVEREWTDYDKMVESFLKENKIEGLDLLSTHSVLSNQVLNVLYRCILPIEPDFEHKITRVKENGNTSVK